MTIAAASNTQCPIFNVGSDEAIEMRDIALTVAHFFEVEVAAPKITDTGVDRYVPSIDSAFTVLGLVNKHDLASSIYETVKQIRGA
jgi:hypothetical protein